MNGQGDLFGVTVQEARRVLRSAREEGTWCPVCDKYARKYWRRFNSTMGRSLIWLVKASGREIRWVDVPNEGPRGVIKTNQHTTCQWWGLIEGMPTDPRSKQKSEGMWRPTAKGILFVHNSVTIPCRVCTYNAEPIAYDEREFLSIDEVLRSDGFDYRELMEGY